MLSRFCKWLPCPASEICDVIYVDLLLYLAKGQYICSARVKVIEGRGSLRLKMLITIYNSLAGKFWAKYVSLIPCCRASVR